MTPMSVICSTGVCSTKYFVLGSCAWFMRFTDHNSIYVRRYERFAKGLISQAEADQMPDLFEIPWAPPSCRCVLGHTMCKTWPLLLFSDQGFPLRRSVLCTSRFLFTPLAVCCFWNLKHGNQRWFMSHFLTFLTPSLRPISYLVLHLSSWCSPASCTHHYVSHLRHDSIFFPIY